MTSPDLDRLIDAAARDMTAMPAPSDLRARVVEEIRRPAGSGFGRVLPAGGWLAAAAGVILAIYLGWPERQPDEPVELPAPKVVQAPRHPAMPPAAPTPAPSAAPARTRPAIRRPEPAPAVASLPALETPEPIGIDPLEASPAPLPALDAVSPLFIEGLEIKPLTSPHPATGGQ